MLMNFLKVPRVPHWTAIEKDTAYVVRDVDTQTATIYFSTKDGDPELFRTTSIDDVYNIFNTLNQASDKISLVTYPTRVDYDNAQLTVDTFVHIANDSDNGNEPTISLYLSDDDSLLRIGDSGNGATVWHSQEW